MKKFIIIGSGDHAKVIASELLQRKKLLGFIDKNKSKISSEFKKYYLGDLSFFYSNKSSNYQVIIGIGRGDLRKKIVDEIRKKKIQLNWGIFVSDKTFIMPDVKISEGSVILKGCIISNRCKIGKHCHLNTGTILDHDNIFNDFASTGPGVITGGNVQVGLESFVGIGSIIKNNIKINSQTVIGSGSVVVKNTKKGSIYFGNPAKFKRLKRDNENYLK